MGYCSEDHKAKRTYSDAMEQWQAILQDLEDDRVAALFLFYATHGNGD